LADKNISKLTYFVLTEVENLSSDLNTPDNYCPCSDVRWRDGLKARWSIAI